MTVLIKVSRSKKSKLECYMHITKNIYVHKFKQMQTKEAATQVWQSEN